MNQEARAGSRSAQTFASASNGPHCFAPLVDDEPQLVHLRPGAEAPLHVVDLGLGLVPHPQLVVAEDGLELVLDVLEVFGAARIA